jgi:hypothetical protein
MHMFIYTHLIFNGCIVFHNSNKHNLFNSSLSWMFYAFLLFFGVLIDVLRHTVYKLFVYMFENLCKIDVWK